LFFRGFHRISGESLFCFQEEVMECPVCKVELKIYVRQGIEVDYCPQCRGVWLDRGELDKIIEAAMADQPPIAPPARPVPAAPPSMPLPQSTPQGYRRDYDDDDDDYRYRGQHGHHKDHYYKKRKKRGLLGEIFDVFD
jgi:uncharacterized protein